MFTYSRKKLFLSQQWHMEVDPYDIFEQNRFWEKKNDDERPSDFSPERWHRIPVPSCWNTHRRELQYYEGPAWYCNRFRFSPRGNVKYFLYFEAANYRTKIWLNGNLVGENEGGFTPFYFDVTKHLQDKNQLVVKVNSARFEDAVPTLIYDWFNFGGITRPVYIFPVAETFIRNYRVSTRIAGGKTIARFEVWIDGPEPPESARVSIPEVKFTGTIPVRKGYGTADFEINPVLWSPQRPKLYQVDISTPGDKITDTVGFREIRAEDENILLNGEPIFLRGICLHEEADGKGRTLSQKEVVERLTWARLLNCDFLRLAHYPHTELMARKADSMGVMLWEEIPVYWKIRFDKTPVLNNARNQLQKLIERDMNRASVICWSVGNETLPGKARNKFLINLIAHARKLDSSRLITAACIPSYKNDGTPYVGDPVADKFDVIGINEYYGWYEKTPEEFEPFGLDHKIRKPVIITEMGGGAVFGTHGPKSRRWTEEFQADLYRRQLAVIRKFDRVRGITPWLMFDFRSPLRVNHWQKGYNRKGVIDNRGRRKAAFKVLRDFYSSMRRHDR